MFSNEKSNKSFYMFYEFEERVYVTQCIQWTDVFWVYSHFSTINNNLDQLGSSRNLGQNNQIMITG